MAERVNFTDIVTVDGTVEAVKSNSIKCPNVYNVTISYIIEDGSQVKAGDTVCILESLKMVTQYKEVEIALEQRKVELNKSKADLAMKYSMLEAEVKNNDAQSAIANLDSLQLKYASETQQKITVLELERAAVQKMRFERRLKALEKINKSELRKIELQIIQGENQLKNIGDKMKTLVLLSPQEGLFVISNSYMGTGKFKQGDQVWPNMNIAEIPDLSVMRVKMQVNESKYKRISLADSVIYSFDAIPGNFASGKVTFKAPIGQSISKDSKIKNYDILASINKYDTLPGAGLSANCKIFVEQNNDTLIVPLIAVFEEDSLKYVYVKNGTSFERREVVVGESSPKDAVISAGLLEGETLALLKPAEKKVKSTVKLSEEVKEKIKQFQALKQSQLPVPVNGNAPRSGSSGSFMRVIRF